MAFRNQSNSWAIIGLGLLLVLLAAVECSAETESPSVNATQRRGSLIVSRLNNGLPEVLGECPEGSSVCPSPAGDLKCYSADQVCDGVVHCSGATDERNCSCGQQVSPVYRCDQYADCPDASDERGCGGCPQGSLSCFPPDDADISSCFSPAQLCDGVRQCEEADEGNSNCFRIVEQPDNTRGPRGWVPKGILQRKSGDSWNAVCVETFPAIDIDAVVKDLCDEVVGDRKAEDQHQPAISFSSAVSCPSNAVYSVRCASPDCHNHLDERSLGRNERFRVIGGSNATEGSWPSIVSLRKDGTHDCGGSVLDSTHVMLAAHCVRNTKNHFYEVSAGVYRRSTFALSVQTVPVAEVILHPKFLGRFLHNDIAILVLERPLLLNKWVRPVCLPETGALLSINHECAVAGWGFMSNLTRTVDRLQHAPVPTTSLELCQKVFGARRLPHLEQVLCAGLEEGGVDACTGDSGGPLLCRACEKIGSLLSCEGNEWQQEGIVSFGIGCAKAGIPGVYTRVRHYLEWIRKVLGSAVKLESVTVGPAKTVHHCLSPYSPSIPLERVCDGKIDCLGGDDEFGYPECLNSTGTQSPSGDLPNGPPTPPKPFSSTLGPSAEQFCAPTHFRCNESNSAVTCVPPEQRCDGTQQCSDGSDESQCSCRRRLYATSRSLLCDGVPDCPDAGDEGPECRLCRDGWWECRESRQCVPESMMCDDEYDCTFGEDEIGCVALASNTSEVFLDLDGAPHRTRTGFLSTRDGVVDRFNPICTNHAASGLLDTVCSYLGFDNHASFEYVESSSSATTYEVQYVRSRSADDFQTTEAPIKHSVSATEKVVTQNSIDVMDNVDYLNASTKSYIANNDVTDFTMESIRSKRQASADGGDRCSQVLLTCGAKRCGKVPRVARSSADYTGFGSQPWAIGVYLEGNYVCGATLVQSQWVLTSSSCLDTYRRNSESLVVVGGSHRGVFASMRMLGPFEREAAVQHVHSITAGVTVLNLVKPLSDNSYINPICLPQSAPSWPGEWQACAMVGVDGQVLTRHIRLAPSVEDCPPHHACFQPYKHDHCASDQWAGLVACLNSTTSTAQWVAVAVWQRPEDGASDCPTQLPLLNDTTLGAIRAAMVLPSLSVIAACPGLRCPLGKCLPHAEVCNGRLDCADFSDEPETCPAHATRCKQPNGPVVCECPSGKLPCWNGSCLAASRFCDGTLDCSDGEDEGDCGCTDGFRCYRSGRNSSCLPMAELCDGQSQCPGEEDETHCSVLLPLPKGFSPGQPIDTRKLGIDLNALGVPEKSSSGLFMLRYRGSWYSYDNTKWPRKYSTRLCLDMGFSKAVTDVRTLLPSFDSGTRASARSVVGVFRGEADGRAASLAMEVVHISCSND